MPNAAPTFTVAPVSTPAGGPITYQVGNIGDGDGDPVTISVDQPEHGTVTIVGGNYVYTPTGTRVDDTITFTATDAYGGITTHTVNVPAAVLAEVVDGVQTPGVPSGPATINADKDRAYQLSYDAASNRSYLTVIDTTTGQAVNSPEQTSMEGRSTGYWSGVQISPNGQYIIVRTYDDNTQTTHLATYDAVTGQQIDEVALAGQVAGDDNGAVDFRGDRGYQVATNNYAPMSSRSTDVAILDADTGQIIGDTIHAQGQGSYQFEFVGTDRAYLYTSRDNYPQDTTWITVIDTETGTIVGTTRFRLTTVAPGFFSTSRPAAST